MIVIRDFFCCFNLHFAFSEATILIFEFIVIVVFVPDVEAQDFFARGKQWRATEGASRTQDQL